MSLIKHRIPLKGITKLPFFGWRTCEPMTDEEILNCKTNMAWRLSGREFIIDIDSEARLTEIEGLLGVHALENIPMVRTSRGYHLYCTLADGIDLETLIFSKDNVDYIRAGFMTSCPGNKRELEDGTIFTYEFTNNVQQPFIIQQDSALIKHITRDNLGSPESDCIEMEGSEIAKFLDKIDATMYANDYNRWFGILAACHKITQGSNEGFAIFFEWCQSASFDGKGADKSTVKTKWKSCRLDYPRSTTHATLLGAAKDSGTKPKELKELKLIVDNSKPKDKPTRETGDEPYNDSEEDTFTAISRSFLKVNQLLTDASGATYAFDKVWGQISSTYVGKMLFDYMDDYKIKMPDRELAMRKIGNLVTKNICMKEPLASLECPDTITLDNGTLNQITGEFTDKFDPKNYSMSKLDFNYIPNSEGAIFNKALGEIMMGDDEMVDYFWETVGYALSFDKSLEMVMLYLGGGSNGKSVVIKIIQKLAGDLIFNSNSKDTGLGGARGSNPHFEANLVGKRVLMIEDMNVSINLDDEAVKKYSGNFQMTANPKNKTPYGFTSRLSLFMCANEYPKFKDLSHGFRRRLNVIPFDRTFSTLEADPHLIRNVTSSDTEMSAAMDKAIAGYQRLKGRGFKFNVPARCLKAKQAWLEESNVMYDFTNNEIEKQPQSYVEMHAMHERYVNFMNAHNEEMGVNTRPKGWRQFNVGMKSLGFELVRMRPDKGSDNRDVKKQYWVNVKLTDGFESQRPRDGM